MGKGFVHFSHAPNESGKGMRRQDIFTGREESTKYDYNADIPLNKYFNLSVTAGSKITWIEIDGVCCYSTRKAQYIELLEKGSLPDEFAEGLEIAVGAGKIGDKKGTRLTIKSIGIVEYENSEPDIPAEIIDLPDLSPFDWYMKSLPDLIRGEAEITNDYLLNAAEIKSGLKFKRSTDKHGNTNYVSPYGLQYRLMKYEPDGKHMINWIQKPSRRDYTSEILDELSETSPELADKLFADLLDCGNTSCGRNAAINYKGQSKTTCANTMNFKWTPSEMSEVREYITLANDIIAKKLLQQSL
jgi:hypothetical protein